MKQPKINTPWGLADGVTTVAPGITFYSTPSHGGYHLSADRIRDMPTALRELAPFTGKAGWYEEDCDWVIVTLAFPEVFPPSAVRHALEFIEGAGFWKHSLACRNWVNLTNAGNRVIDRSREAA